MCVRERLCVCDRKRKPGTGRKIITENGNQGWGQCVGGYDWEGPAWKNRIFVWSNNYIANRTILRRRICSNRCRLFYYRGVCPQKGFLTSRGCGRI